jgi:hypothetical protein
MELPEGTWVLHFVKKGYFPALEEVTVGPLNPRIEIATEMIPSVPMNPSPADGSTVADDTPLLDWDDVVTASHYQIQMNNSSDFTGILLVDVANLVQSEYQVGFALADNETYYWRVRARNSAGIPGDWSDEWHFGVSLSPLSSINFQLSASGLSMQMVSVIDEGSTDSYKNMTLTSYALSQSEVTQGDYVIVMGSNPSNSYGVGDEYPVYYINWFDAAQFCNTLSSLFGLEQVYNESTWEADFPKDGFYLPTEAQWEYAAGGPNHYIWSLSDTFNSSDYVCLDTQTRPVMSHPANGFGLYDTSGNVNEWCHDWYGSTFPHVGATDPSGPSTGTRRIRRGYGFTGDADYLRVELRAWNFPDLRAQTIGIRVAVGGFGKW